MKFRILALGAVLVLLALFALLNWPAFTALTPLSMGFAEASAPLGLIMLVAIGVVSGLFLFVLPFQQAGVIVESRRTAKELKGHHPPFADDSAWEKGRCPFHLGRYRQYA